MMPCSGRSRGSVSDGQLRTLQRRIKIWRATEGPAKEIFFPQEHYPGDLCASDFTDMNEAGSNDRGATVRAFGVPFCADVFELGDREHLFFRELRKPERRDAECAVGAWGCAEEASDRPVVGSGA